MVCSQGRLIIDQMEYPAARVGWQNISAILEDEYLNVYKVISCGRVRKCPFFAGVASQDSGYNSPSQLVMAES